MHVPLHLQHSCTRDQEWANRQRLLSSPLALTSGHWVSVMVTFVSSLDPIKKHRGGQCLGMSVGEELSSALTVAGSLIVEETESRAQEIA